ncbi:MAG: fumarylacetoacetate hydrolase family protein [Chloroflexota bacterium]|nr:fumarylacetoacetate hydrolase family protein [Chloroflexota bacterium]
MIERASRDSRIAPGDVLASGTVGGGSIGEAMRKGYEKARYLEPGDVVELEVEGIGVLRNRIAPKADPDPAYRFRAAQPVTPAVRGGARDYVFPGRRP